MFFKDEISYTYTARLVFDDVISQIQGKRRGPVQRIPYHVGLSTPYNRESGGKGIG